MRFVDGKTMYALKEHTDIFIFFRCMRNGVTETYFGLCILSIQSKTLTTFHLQCVSWYNICVPVNLHIYPVQDESVRTESFVHWRTDKYDIKTLVDAGFSCSDSGSYIVECTSCGLCVDCSELRGAPYDFHKRKSPHCEFFKDSMRSLPPSRLHKNDKTDKTNGRNYEHEQEPKYLQKKPPEVKSFSPRYPQYAQAKKRSETFKHENWSNNNQLQTPDQLSRAGFFYTGYEDLVRCYYCGGGLRKWELEDDPCEEHARCFPDCHFLLKVKGKEFVQDVHKKRNSEPVQLSIQAPTAAPNSGIESASECPQNGEVIYDRKASKGETVSNPSYRMLSTRCESYANWPHRTVHDVNELANAGFFYTGDGDTVRCHYCDGGLREWEPEDDPWVEHARWFPFCKFVLKIKGIDFIQASAAGNRSQYQSNTENLPPSGNTRQGKRDFKATDLMGIILEKEAAGEIVGPSDEEDSDVDTDHLTIEALKKENENLQKRLKCKICKEVDRCIIFLPCGHLIACTPCGRQMVICLVCGSRITTQLKTSFR